MPTTLAEINAMDQATFVATLGPLFEHSPWVAEATWERRPFRDTEHLHAELCATVDAACEHRQFVLIASHPDLAGVKAFSGELSAASAEEQAAAGLTSMQREEIAQFTALNGWYRNRFGFPFVICARQHNRESIVAEMKRRLGNEPAEERETALAEIRKIAWLRLEAVLAP